MSQKCKPEDIPYVTTDQMIEVDRAMIEDCKIELIQMMENAGRNLASLARERFLGGDPIGKRVVVLAGTGGNGGGALVAARRLHNWGVHVRVFLTKPAADFAPVIKRFEEGPTGFLTVVPRGVPNMGKNMVLSLVYYLLVGGLRTSRSSERRRRFPWSR